MSITMKNTIKPLRQKSGIAKHKIFFDCTARNRTNADFLHPGRVSGGGHASPHALPPRSPPFLYAPRANHGRVSYCAVWTLHTGTQGMCRVWLSGTGLSVRVTLLACSSSRAIPTAGQHSVTLPLHTVWSYQANILAICHSPAAHPGEEGLGMGSVHLQFPE